MSMEKPQKKGLIYVITGDGKGKTTASFGLALRAAGHGWKTLIIQFMKNGGNPESAVAPQTEHGRIARSDVSGAKADTWKSGEVEYIAKHIPEIDVISCGGGFVGIAHDDKPKSHHIKKAQEAFKIMSDKIKKGDYQLLILDEINVAIDLKLIKLSHVTYFLKTKPQELHIVLTGRNAHPRIIKLADMVSEIKNIKHPFDSGTTAQQGIDF